MEVSFTINGKPYTVKADEIPVDTTLHTFLRTNAHLRGTKFMCLEGGCGVCLVTLKGTHPITNNIQTWAANSCLKTVFSCHGLDITTIEGVGNKKDGYHPIQKKLYEMNGTQCGYCSPGMVINMYSLLESKNGNVTMKEIENSFGGNICRCTGYRPILDAFKAMATDSDTIKSGCNNDEWVDIEDLKKTCPTTGKSCSGTCHTKTNNPIQLLFKEDKQFFKVNTLAETFDILDKSGTKPYMLVAGCTAHGVYRRSPDLQVFIEITGIQELRSHTLSADKLIIGAGNSLTETMEILTTAAETKGFEYCTEMVKHIDLIASVPVRNGGTIAGNFSIKHAHNDFPSDMFLILEAVGAQMTIFESGNKSTIVSIEEFLNIDMNKKVIGNVILKMYDPSRFIFRSYKIMPRAQNAHAYVNAGFLFEILNGQVQSSRICFGGINSKFIHAKDAEKQVKCKMLYENATLQTVIDSLYNELNPDWVLPEGSPEYRKNLAISLFYKFILNTCPKNKLTPINVSGGDVFDRPLSSGQQSYDTNKKMYPLTEPVPKYEGLIQCSGEAQFVNDIRYHKDELWAAFVPATRPHATIGKIDPSEALKIPGVHSFYSAKDVPGKNNFAPAVPFNFVEEEIFVGEDKEILYHGQPLGMILADSMAIANLATTKVKVTYVEATQSSNSMYSMARSLLNPFIGNEKKQIIPTIKDVFNLNAHDRITEFPSCKLEATHYGINTTKTLTGTFEIGSQYHYTMETQTTVCVPNDDELDVFCATQWPDYAHIAISECLDIPQNKINIITKRMGGGYGAKISRSALVACACALASFKTNRVVRFVMTIESNMATLGKRYALITNYDIDVDDNGKIQKLKNIFTQDFGCSANEPINYFTINFVKNCYIGDSWNVKSQAAITDAPSHTWCRAPGTTEAIAMTEHMMEHIAKIVGKDPMDVRFANMSEDSEIRKMMPDFLNETDYHDRKKKVNEFNSQNRWKKRGISVVPMKYPQEYIGNFPVYVAIYYMDGTVAVTHGGTECGQGINTKVAQVAAHVLNLPLKMISIKGTDTLTSANTNVTGGSITSEVVCYGVKKACEQILERMKPIRDTMKDASWTTLTQTCQMHGIDLTEKYLAHSNDNKEYIIWGLSCAEVELDLLTGNLQLKRVDILEDVGESMSPLVDVGQIEGAFVMGIGYWLSEHLVYNRENGELMTNRTWNYKPPGVKDIPIDFRIRFLRKSSNPFGVLRSKATGEPSFCMSIVVLFALRNAIDSARKDAGLEDQWYHLGSGSTPEICFLAAGNDPKKFTL